MKGYYHGAAAASRQATRNDDARVAIVQDESRMGIPALASLCLLALAARPQDSALMNADLLQPPSVGGKPVRVTIGYYFLDFARITARDESFDATGYLEMTWRDPRLVGRVVQANAKKSARVDPARVWTPKVFFDNALERPQHHNDAVIEVEPDGLVSSWVIVSCKFSSALDLRRFPFDRQTLSVRIGAYDDISTVEFEPHKALVQLDENAFITDWLTERPTARVDSRRYVPGQEIYAHYVYQLSVQRRPAFYIWRVIVPLSLLTIVSFAAFWFEPVGLQPQISTCMATLIALVAFTFAIDFSLPKVSYLTLIDKHALICFGFVAAVVVEVAVVHRAVVGERLKFAGSVQRASRWVFPLCYAAALVLNFAVF